MMFCARSMCLTFSLLAGAQAAAIAETEQHASLEAAGDREQAARLVLAHHQRNLLRLAEMINLGRKVQPPQCHAEQELHPIMMLMLR
jgi:hypothetical protein